MIPLQGVNVIKQMAELVDALVSNTNGVTPVRFDPVLGASSELQVVTVSRLQAVTCNSFYIPLAENDTRR